MRNHTSLCAIHLFTLVLAVTARAQISEAHGQIVRLIDDGKYREARAFATAAIGKASPTAQPCELAALHFDRGTAEHLLVQYNEAQAAFARSLELCGRKAGAPGLVAAVLASLGEVHAVLGKFEDASRELRSARQIAETLPQADEVLSRVHGSLGILEPRQGYRSRAERIFAARSRRWRLRVGPLIPASPVSNSPWLARCCGRIA